MRYKLLRCRRSRRLRPIEEQKSHPIRAPRADIKKRRRKRTTSAGMPMPVSFFLYSARDLVLLFVTNMICLPVKEGEVQMMPTLRGPH